MAKKRRKKRHSPRPPLSLRDKCVYWSALGLLVVSVLLLAFGVEEIMGRIAFGDPTVVAYKEHASFLLIIPFFMYVFISGLVFLLMQLSDKVPIFGKSGIRYGEPPWDKTVYPLFDPRRKRAEVRPSEKKRRRGWVTLWCAGLLLLLLIAPLGLYGRDCLHSDRSIDSYDMFNRPSDRVYTTSDYARLIIKNRYVHGYRTADRWVFSVEIEMEDGKSFTFSDEAFDWRKENGRELRLETMQGIKQQFSPDEITIIGAKDVDKAADYFGFTDTQRQMMKELFTP